MHSTKLINLATLINRKNDFFVGHSLIKLYSNDIDIAICATML